MYTNVYLVSTETERDIK